MDIREAVLAQQGERRHVWERARFQFVKKSLLRHLPGFGQKGDALLDVGCGDGWFLERLAEEFPLAEFTGADNALTPAVEAEMNSRRPNMRVSRSLPENVRKPYRAVLLLDVLEHLENDAAFLKNLAQNRALEDAVFLITVPSFGFLFSAHDRFLGHHRRYNRGQLVQRAGSAGLRVVESGYFFHSLLPVRLAQKTAQLVFGAPGKTPAGVAGWRAPAIVDAMFLAMLNADTAVSSLLARFRLYLPGLSCHAVCRKP